MPVPRSSSVKGCRQFIVRGNNTISQLTQCLVQGGLRSLVHARHPFKPKHPFPQTNQRGEESCCRAGIPHIQIQGPLLRTSPRHLSTQTSYCHYAVADFLWVWIDFQFEPE